MSSIIMKTGHESMENTGLTNMLQRYLKKAMVIRAEHIEMMAAAYCKKTCIDPRDVVLVEEHDGNIIRWYFTTRQEIIAEQHMIDEQRVIDRELHEQLYAAAKEEGVQP